MGAQDGEDWRGTARDVPDPIKREVRKRCHFGCVFCGMPIFDYDHIDQFAKVKTHHPDNIVLLCPNHHREKTAGRLSVERVQHAASKPFNSGRQNTSAMTIETSRSVSVVLGGSEFIDDFYNNSYHILMINQRAYLSLYHEDGWTTFSTIVTDMRGIEILRIVKGQLIVSTGMWDFVYEGVNLKMWSESRQIALELTLSNDRFEMHRGCFLDARDMTGVIADRKGSLIALRRGEPVGLMMNVNFGGGYIGVLQVTNTRIAEVVPGMMMTHS